MAKLGSVGDALSYGEALLVGERVRLRQLQEDDLPFLEEWWELPAWSVLQQYTVRPRQVGVTSDDFRRWSENKGPEAVGFSIESLESKQFVGHVTLWGARVPERTATLGIIIGPDFTRQGLGADATRVAVGYGFRQLGLNRVELRCAAFNTVGLRAYLRAGFKEEGRRREALFMDGEFHDEVMMGLVLSDWQDSSRGKS